MAAITSVTQATPPGGGPVTLGFLPRTGLNFAINAMVAPRFRAPCENRFE